MKVWTRGSRVTINVIFIEHPIPTTTRPDYTTRIAKKKSRTASVYQKNSQEQSHEEVREQ